MWNVPRSESPGVVGGGRGLLAMWSPAHALSGLPGGVMGGP